MSGDCWPSRFNEEEILCVKFASVAVVGALRVLAVVVDVDQSLLDDLAVVEFRRCGDLASENHRVVLDHGLARHSTAGIIRETGI